MRRQKLIPESSIELFMRHLRDVTRFVQTSCSIPPAAYAFRYFLFFLQLSLPGLVTEDEHLWQGGRASTRIVQFFSFFVYWGANYDATVLQRYSTSAASMGFAVLFLLFTTAVMLVQKKLGKVPQWLGKVILWVIDIIMPSVLVWQFAESGSGIAWIIEGNGGILPVVMAHAILYILHILYYPEVAYHPARSIFWSGSSQAPMTLLIGWLVFLGSFCGEVHGTVMNVAYGLFILVIICGVAAALRLPKFIGDTYNNIFNGLIVASALTSIIQLVRIFDVNIDQDIVMLVSPTVAVLAIFIFQAIGKRKKMKYLVILDVLQDSGEEFDTFVRSPRRLVDMYRTCFATAHPYLLTWEMFVRGTEMWPRNKTLLEQYLRLTAIYQTQTVESVRVSEMIKRIYPNDPYMKTLRRIVKAIAASRSGRVTSELRHTLKDIRTRQNGVVSLQAAYWSALGEGSVTAVYDLCRSIVVAQEEIEASYMKLITERPHSEAIYMRFFLFLEKIECDQKEADVWKMRYEARYEAVHNNPILTDLTQTLGHATFPSLPVFHPLDSHQRAPVDDKKSTISISRASISTFSSIQDSLTLPEQEIERITHAANMRASGLHMHLPFVDVIIWLVCILFVLILLAGPAITSQFILHHLQAVQDYWSAVKSSNDLAGELVYLDFLLSLDAGRYDGFFLTKDEEDAALNISVATDAKVDDLIADSVLVIQDLAQSLVQSVSKCYGKAGDAWQNYFQMEVMMRDFQNEEYEAHLNEAVEALTQTIRNYDPKTPFSKEKWFQVFDENSMVPVLPLFEWSNNIFQGLLSSSDDAFIDTKVAMVAMSIVSGIFLVALFIAIAVLHHKWKYIVECMARLPKAAVHKVIAKFFRVSRNSRVMDDERLYNNDFLKMATARVAYGGIPTSRLSMLSFAALAVGILCVVFAYATISDNLDYISAITNRYNQLAGFSVSVYATCSQALHLAALKSGNMFPSDETGDPATSESALSQAVIAYAQSVTDALDSLLVGSLTMARQAGFMTDENPEAMITVTRLPTNASIAEVSSMHHYIYRNPDFTYLCFLEFFCNDIATNVRGNVLNERTDSLLIMNHMLVQHYHIRVYKTYSDMHDKYVKARLQEFREYTLGMPYIFSIIGLAICLTIIWLLVSVKRTIRQSLAMLSLVDFEVIASDNVITDLVGGSFSKRHDESPNSKTLLEVADQSNYVILEVSPEMTVKYANKAIERKWNVKENDYQDISLPLIISFDISKKETQKNVDVVFVADQRHVRMNIFVYHINDNKNKSNFIYFFEDLSERELREQELQHEYDKIEKMKRDIIPPGLVSRIVKDKNSWTFVSDDIALFTTTFTDFDRVCHDENAVDVLKQYKSRIHDFISDKPDVIHIKSTGITDYFAVNLLNTLPSKRKVDAECFDICRSLCQHLMSHGMSAGFTMTTETKVVVGLMNQNVLSFDLFGRSMRVCRVLLHQAKSGYIVMDKLQCLSIPECVPSDQLNPICVAFGTTSYPCFEYQVPAPPPPPAPASPPLRHPQARHRSSISIPLLLLRTLELFVNLVN